MNRNNLKVSLFYSFIFSHILNLWSSAPAVTSDVAITATDPNLTNIIDGYPVYFKCQLNRLTIIFKRKNINYLSLSSSFRAYESTSIKLKQKTVNYSASAILFPHFKFFSYTKLFPSQKLLDTFEINIRIHQPDRKQSILVTLNHTNWAYSLTQVKDNVQIQPAAKKRQKKFIRSMKARLKVEACIHISNEVYISMQSFLSTTNQEYIQMYLSIVYLQYFSGVNRIYESMSDPYFSIRVDLVSLVIHKVPFLNADRRIEEYMSLLNREIYDFYNKSAANQKCDHVFFVTNDRWKKRILGMAYVGQVCQNMLASLIMHNLSGDIDQTLAHELAHSLGAEHDNTPNKKTNRSSVCNNKMLMEPSLVANRSGHTLSSCSISDIRQTLFYSANNTLKEMYKCLKITSFTSEINSLTPYQQILSAESHLSGHYYSLSDQCRLATLQKDAYSVMKETDIKCKVYCCTATYFYNSILRCEYTVFSALDGTRCGENKICISDECQNDPTFYKHIQLENPPALQVASICPNGVRQNKSIVSKLECQNNCEKLEYRSQCCEACIKYSIVLKSIVTKQVSVCKTSESNPCYNGGVCVDDDKEIFICRCPRGFGGDLCLEYKPCRIDQCQESEICHEIGELGFYACLCLPGQSGYPTCRKEFIRSYDNSLFERTKAVGYRALINCVFAGLVLVGMSGYIIYYLISSFIYPDVVKS